MFDRLDEEKSYKIAVLFMIVAILMSIGLIINGVIKTCDENYNPCSMCMKAGYRVVNPNDYMASIADSPQYINRTWNISLES